MSDQVPTDQELEEAEEAVLADEEAAGQQPAETAARDDQAAADERPVIFAADQSPGGGEDPAERIAVVVGGRSRRAVSALIAAAAALAIFVLLAGGKPESVSGPDRPGALTAEQQAERLIGRIGRSLRKNPPPPELLADSGRLAQEIGRRINRPVAPGFGSGLPRQPAIRGTEGIRRKVGEVTVSVNVGSRQEPDLVVRSIRVKQPAG